MKLLSYLPYVLLFMLATMVVYGWGLLRAQRAAQDDAKLLYSKGVSRIRRALKKRGALDRAELAGLVQGLTAARPFSKRRIAVTDVEAFLDALLPYMETQKMLVRTQEKGRTVYRLKS